MSERDFIHLNLSHFMVAVEEVCDRNLKCRPVAVAPAYGPRSIVFDVSQSGADMGVARGMFLGHALNICPDLKVIPPRPELYQRAVRKMYSLVSSMVPVVEMQERGHFFLDISGMRRLIHPVDYAAKIRHEIISQLSLDPVTAVASNKLVAKVATRVVKPVGLLSVSCGDEALFLSPQQIELLPGVGEKTRSLLLSLGIVTVGDFAQLDAQAALQLFGRRGVQLYRHAHGEDERRVEPAGMHACVETSFMFSTDTADPDEVSGGLRHAVEQCGYLLRLESRSLSRLSLLLSYADGKALKKSIDCGAFLSSDRDIWRMAQALCKALWNRRVRLSSLTLRAGRLASHPCQLDLFSDEDEVKNSRLEEVFDQLRHRFGFDAVGYAAFYKKGA